MTSLLEDTIRNELPKITQLLKDILVELKEQRKILVDIEKWTGK